jgi:phage terminase small subunit
MATTPKILTPKQARFIEEYIVDLNATQAAIRAGYSVRSAKDIGCQNLAKLYIQEAIAEAIAERSQRTKITQDRVLEEYARLAFLDPRQFFDDEGNLKNIKDLADDSAAALSSIEICVIKIDNNVETTTAKIKFWDKSRNLNDLAKHLGLFKEDYKQKCDGGPIPVIVEFVDPPLREKIPPPCLPTYREKD